MYCRKAVGVGRTWLIYRSELVTSQSVALTEMSTPMTHPTLKELICLQGPGK